MAGYYPELDHAFENDRCIKCGIIRTQANLASLSFTRCPNNQTHGWTEIDENQNEPVPIKSTKSIQAQLNELKSQVEELRKLILGDE